MTHLTYEEAVECYYEHLRASGCADDEIECPCSTRSEHDENVWRLENVNGPLAHVSADGIVTPTCTEDADVEGCRQPLAYEQAVDRYMRSTFVRRPEPVKRLSALRGTTWHLANDHAPCAEVSCDGTVTVLNKSLCEQYCEWCNEHSRYESTLGKYGPELRIRIDVPLQKVADLMLEAGVEPTLWRLAGLLSELQANYFDDPHNGCDGEDVNDYLLYQAASAIDKWVHDDTFNEFYPLDGSDDQIDQKAAEDTPDEEAEGQHRQREKLREWGEFIHLLLRVKLLGIREHEEFDTSGATVQISPDNRVVVVLGADAPVADDWIVLDKEWVMVVRSGAAEG